MLITSLGHFGAPLRELRPFAPWLLTTAAGLDAVGEHWRDVDWTHLRGEGLSRMASFRSWDAWLRGRGQLRGLDLPYLAYANPVKQFLVHSGLTTSIGPDTSPGARRLAFVLPLCFKGFLNVSGCPAHQP